GPLSHAQYPWTIRVSLLAKLCRHPHSTHQKSDCDGAIVSGGSTRPPRRCRGPVHPTFECHFSRFPASESIEEDKGGYGWYGGSWLALWASVGLPKPRAR